MPTVGIVKGLLYYRYEVLWKAFFDDLNVSYVTSGDSNFKMLESGKNKCVDETCLSLKLFVGHVESLKDKCDCIFVPRMYSLEKTEQVCTNFNCLYDLIHNLYPELKIVNYNVDVKHHHDEQEAFIKLGKELGFSRRRSKKAYEVAKRKEFTHLKEVAERQQEKLKTNKTKILMLGHPYNTRDALIGKVVTDFLQKYPIEIIYSDEMPRQNVDELSRKISPRVHWTMNKELLASFMYYKDKVDGTILITAFPCGPDSLTNEMILRKKDNSKVLLLNFEDLNSDVAILTRLESFLDMLKGGVHL